MTLLQDVRQETQFVAMEIRVRGRVQGVGFRPTVWRIARELDLTGEVLNDCEGVLVRVGGSPSAVGDFIARLESEPPPLARIDKIEVRAFDGALPSEFRIAESLAGDAHTEVAPDAAICRGLRSGNRRSVPAPLPLSVRQLHALRAAPQHRQGHPLRSRQYDDVAVCDVRGVRGGISQSRRPPFPRRSDRVPCLRSARRGWSVSTAGRRVSTDIRCSTMSMRSARLITKGEIVAIKGLGGFHLACDATNAEAVARLRRLKRRDAKPFALMARDLDVIRRYCTVGAEEERALVSPAAPIVLLAADKAEKLPDEVAPGLRDPRLHAADDAAASADPGAHGAPGGDDQRQCLRGAAGHRR